MFQIEFYNRQDSLMVVQVDPWACVYSLKKGESIEFAMKATSEEPRFSVYEYDGGNRILTLWNCDEFFVNVEGKPVHWQAYQTNLPEQE